LLPHVLAFTAATNGGTEALRTAVPNGTLVDDVKILHVEPEHGLSCQIGANLAAFVHVRWYMRGRQRFPVDY
jgi:hypothetical protein